MNWKQELRTYIVTQGLGVVLWIIGAGIEYADPHNLGEGSGGWAGEAVANTGFLSWWLTVTTAIFLLVLFCLYATKEGNDD